MNHRVTMFIVAAVALGLSVVAWSGEVRPALDARVTRLERDVRALTRTVSFLEDEIRWHHEHPRDKLGSKGDPFTIQRFE